jgi:hypothetical protein
MLCLNFVLISATQKLADGMLVTVPCKSNMAVQLYVKGLMEQAGGHALSILPEGVLLAPGAPGSNTWGAEEEGEWVQAC